VEQLESSYSELLSLLKPNHLGESTRTADPGTQSTAAADSGPLRDLGGIELGASGIPTPEQMSSAELESSVNDYRRLSRRNFPYVLLGATDSAASLIEERPMLAQAILVTTSWRSPQRQSTLKAKFLADVSQQYFFRNEKSLDLLQAMIVYTAWLVIWLGTNCIANRFQVPPAYYPGHISTLSTRLPCGVSGLGARRQPETHNRVATSNDRRSWGYCASG
jgi:hypothetical protein